MSKFTVILEKLLENSEAEQTHINRHGLLLKKLTRAFQAWIIHYDQLIQRYNLANMTKQDASNLLLISKQLFNIYIELGEATRDIGHDLGRRAEILDEIMEEIENEWEKGLP